MTGNLKLFELKKLEDTRMKIVIINGSARKGNTLTAINAFIKGASKKNEIEIIEPDKLNIAPCKGCGVCQCSKGCVDKDDTNPTIDKIAATDMILFATPVYWWGMSAQLKLLNPTNSTLHHARDVVSVNALRDASIRMIQILLLIKLLPQI